MLERQLRDEGLSPADAHAAARRRFGNDLGARERSRDEWGFAWLDPPCATPVSPCVCCAINRW